VVVAHTSITADRQVHAYFEGTDSTKFKLDLKVYGNGTLIQVLYFWTLSIVLSLSKKPSYLFSKTQCFGG
jgi:hypothetical protein